MYLHTLCFKLIVRLNMYLLHPTAFSTGYALRMYKRKGSFCELGNSYQVRFYISYKMSAEIIIRIIDSIPSEVYQCHILLFSMVLRPVYCPWPPLLSSPINSVADVLWHFFLYLAVLQQTANKCKSYFGLVYLKSILQHFRPIVLANFREV